MDTLSIIQKLKKKRPELANDPLMAELELGLVEGEDDPLNPKKELGAEGDEERLVTSYLDEEEGEAEADAFMDELDAEEDEEAPAASYLDMGEEDEDEMPLPPRRKRRPVGRMSRF